MTAMAWRRALVAATVATMGVGAIILPAGAVEAPAALGWWWAGRPSGMFPALYSPEVPESGLYVAGGVAGPSGISAVRYELDPDTNPDTLTLTIADVTGTIAIDACPAADGWEPAENGGWDQRPAPDCDAATITGAVDEDETQVSFTLSSLRADDGVIDVVLVPGVDSESQDRAGFEVTFEAPDANALAVTDTGSSSTPPAAETAPAAPTVATTPPAPGSFAAPAAPAPDTPVEGGTPAESEIAIDAPPRASGPRLTTGLVDSEGFAYPAVLAMPLVLLVAASYVGWALTRPLAVIAPR